MSERVSALVLAGLVALAVGVQAGQKQAPSASFQRLWYQAYDEGVRAVLRAYGSTGGSKSRDLSSYVPIGTSDLRDAIANLESAKRSGPAPGRRVLFQGDRVDVFNPDYYLGLAYYASGRFADAEDAFSRVAKDKLVVPGDPQAETLRKMTAFATYERLLADGERAVRAGRFADAEKIIGVVTAPDGVAAVADQETLDARASGLLARVREGAAKLATTITPPPTGVRIDEPVAPPAYDPTTDQKVALNDGKTPVSEPAKDPKAGPLEPVKEPPGVPVSEPAAPPRVAVNPPTRAPADPVKSPSVPPVGAALDEAAATLRGTMAYYEGNYEEAIRVLTPVFRVDPPSNVVALYMACSQAALVASGRADRSVLAEARETFTYARGGGTTIERHLRYISPRVREMLGDVPATAR